MKKVVMLLMIVVILSGVCFGSDPNVVAVKPAVGTAPPPPLAPMRLRVLPQTKLQVLEFDRWRDAYGTGDPVQLYYNTAALLKNAEHYGRLIDRNRDFIVMILGRDDPNSLASVVVKNRMFIDALIKGSGLLRRQVAQIQRSVGVEIQIKELAMRVADLENENKELRKMMGVNNYGKRIRTTAGSSEVAGDNPQPEEGSAGGGDSLEDIAEGSGGDAGAVGKADGH